MTPLAQRLAELIVPEEWTIGSSEFIEGWGLCRGKVLDRISKLTPVALTAAFRDEPIVTFQELIMPIEKVDEIEARLKFMEQNKNCDHWHRELIEIVRRLRQPQRPEGT